MFFFDFLLGWNILEHSRTQKMLTFEGATWLRQRLVLAVLSGQAVRVDGIRALDDDPGLLGRDST